MTAYRTVGALFGLMMGVAGAWAFGDSPTPNRPVAPATVGNELRAKPEYRRYLEFLTQIDALADPRIANLPIAMDVREDGVIAVQGSVPTAVLKEYVLANVARISGRKPVDGLRVVQTPEAPEPKVDARDLEAAARDAIATLFSEKVANAIVIRVSPDNVVLLQGAAHSYEMKLLLSQAIKSQPGCRGVANMLEVHADPATGMLAITDDGGFQLRADSLPAIPPARPFDEFANREPSVVRRLVDHAPPLADDAPEANADDQRIREDAMTQFQREVDLVNVKIEVEVRDGVVTLAGAFKSREQTQLAIDVVAVVHGVTKVVAKSTPYAIQRNLPTASRPESSEPEPPPTRWTKLRRLLPGGKDDSKFETPQAPRKLRATVRKTIEKRCGNRVHDVEVRQGLHALLIEAKVKSALDRAFFFKQLDNIMELRNLRYDAVVKVDEK